MARGCDYLADDLEGLVVGESRVNEGLVELVHCTCGLFQRSPLALQATQSSSHPLILDLSAFLPFDFSLLFTTKFRISNSQSR